MHSTSRIDQLISFNGKPTKIIRMTNHMIVTNKIRFFRVSTENHHIQKANTDPRRYSPSLTLGLLPQPPDGAPYSDSTSSAEIQW